MQQPRSDAETDREIDERRDAAADLEVATPSEAVSPREAYGNTGWNDPVAEAPESLEGAVRRADDPQNGAPRPAGDGGDEADDVDGPSRRR